MKKFIKIIMTLALILGIGFSILNFTSLELNCIGIKGVWVGDDCMGDGQQCDIRARYELPG